MKRLGLLIFIGLFLVLTQNASAQSKKLLVFKKGAAVASGTIKGAEAKTFYFKVKKNTDIDISIDEADKRPKFTLFKPNGKPFYEDGSVNEGETFDILDILPDAGIYKIILKLSNELQGETQPIKFTLRLILK